MGAAAIAIGARSEEWAQKSKFVANRVRIDGRCVPVVSAAKTAI